MLSVDRVSSVAAVSGVRRSWKYVKWLFAVLSCSDIAGRTAAVRDGVGHAERQQRGLPAAGRTVLDLLIHMNNQAILCDITVTDTLANSNLATAASGPAKLAEEAAKGKVDKYQLVADAMRAVHLPFAVETTGGLSESAQRLIGAIHLFGR